MTRVPGTHASPPYTPGVELMPPPGTARSPNGRFTAWPDGLGVALVDPFRPLPQGDPWPLPDAAERKSYHSEQATLAEKQQQHFAAAFHLGQLLLDSPDAALKKRRDAALAKHAGK